MLEKEISREWLEKLSPVIEPAGYRIVEIGNAKIKGSLKFNISVHKEGGITVDDCSVIHKLLYPRLQIITDNQEIDLEIASPGISRNMKSWREMEVFTGSKVRVLLQEGSEWIKGTISEADSESVKLDTGKEIIKLGSEEIRKAKLDY